MEGKFIIIIAVALFFIALVQLMKIYDLAAKVRGAKSQEKMTRGENMLMANLMLVFMVVFFGFIIWLIAKYGANAGLYKAASEHGEKLDSLLMLNWYIILPVFFFTNSLLFIFSWRYYHREERKALYYPHNNKLELVWTILPAIALAIIIVFGIRTWNDIMYNKEKGQVVEVYAYQFGWLVRYAGVDNQLGEANYKLVSSTNPLGVITDKSINDTYEEIDKKVSNIDQDLKGNRNKNGDLLIPKSKADKKLEELERLKRRKYRIEAAIDKGESNPTAYSTSDDDVVVQELHLVKDQPYTFIFRSKDVIHCPWLPHFRAQINAVPGMETSFKLTPTITTKEMRMMPEVQEHYKNINEIHNERKRRIGEEEEKVLFDYVYFVTRFVVLGIQTCN